MRQLPERNSKVLVSVTILRDCWICTASRRRRPSSVAIVAILLLIKYTVYHLGCCRNGLSIKTTFPSPLSSCLKSCGGEAFDETRCARAARLRRLTYFVHNYYPSSSRIVTFSRCITCVVTDVK